MTEKFVIAMLAILRALSPVAMERTEAKIRAAGRDGIDKALPWIGMELGRMLEEAGQDYNAGHAVAHILASEVFASIDDDARHEGIMEAAEADARWHAQCDRELEWADRDYQQFGYSDA